MMHFDDFVQRHGEVVAQALLENLEHAEGLRMEQVMHLTLEQRWQQLINNNQRQAA